MDCVRARLGGRCNVDLEDHGSSWESPLIVIGELSYEARSHR